MLLLVSKELHSKVEKSSTSTPVIVTIEIVYEELITLFSILYLAGSLGAARIVTFV